MPGEEVLQSRRRSEFRLVEEPGSGLHQIFREIRIDWGKSPRSSQQIQVGGVPTHQDGRWSARIVTAPSAEKASLLALPIEVPQIPGQPVQDFSQ